jgi:hypothetical protein
LYVILSFPSDAITWFRTTRLNALRRGGTVKPVDDLENGEFPKTHDGINDNLFLSPYKVADQRLVDAIIDAIFYYAADRERIRNDPLVRLLLPNPPGGYNFAIVTAMGVIT